MDAYNAALVPEGHRVCLEHDESGAVRLQVDCTLLFPRFVVSCPAQTCHQQERERERASFAHASTSPSSNALAPFKSPACKAATRYRLLRNHCAPEVAISVWAHSPRCCSTQAYRAIWISCPIVSSCLDHSFVRCCSAISDSQRKMIIRDVLLPSPPLVCTKLRASPLNRRHQHEAVD